jgi:hypothetical protein
MTAPPGEKRGNTAWCQCARCAGWFPIAPSLARELAIALHCPHCHAEFQASEAKRIARPE